MRVARLQLPGLVHHLIWRCLNREWLITDESHRSRYLWWLGRALEDSDWKCIAYAVMSNHVHIAAIAGEEPLARWSRRVNTPFALWMNGNSNRLGPFSRAAPPIGRSAPWLPRRRLLTFTTTQFVRGSRRMD